MLRRRKIRTIAGIVYMTCTKCEKEYPMTDVWFLWSFSRNHFHSQCKICRHITRSNRWEREKSDPEKHEKEKARQRKLREQPMRRARMQAADNRRRERRRTKINDTQ